MLPQRITHKEQYHCWIDRTNMEKYFNRKEMMPTKAEESVSRQTEYIYFSLVLLLSATQDLGCYV